MASWRFIITGCGTSHGTPAWGVRELWSVDPRDHRRRSGGLLLAEDGRVVLFDCGPDLAHQLIDPYKNWNRRDYPVDCITRCDGVLLTHDHADHTHGVNELRHLNRLMGGTAITIYGWEQHLARLRQQFAYCFGNPDSTYQLAQPALRSQLVTWGSPIACAGLDWLPLEISHGPAGPVTAYRCGPFAYVTDVKSVPSATRAALQGLELLVLGCLRQAEHPTHMNWAEAHDLISELKPQRTVLVHAGHEVQAADWQPWLPEGVELAYDGWFADLKLPASKLTPASQTTSETES